MSTTPEAFAPLDTACLDDIDAAAAYLEAVFEEAGDDPAVVAQALGTIARSGNVSELARRTGTTRPRSACADARRHRRQLRR